MPKHTISRADEIYFGSVYKANVNTDNRPAQIAPPEYFSLGNPIAADDDALIDAATATELPNANTVTYTFPATGSPQDNSVGQDGDSNIPFGRTVTVSASAAFGASSYTITGTNPFGETVVEDLTIAASGTSAETDKAFTTVTQIAITATGNMATATGSTVNIGWGRKFGLPRRVDSANKVFQVMHDGAPITDWSITAGDTTSPATSTTNDVRGLINLGTGTNANLATGKELSVFMVSAAPSGNTNYFGVTDYSG